MLVLTPGPAEYEWYVFVRFSMRAAIQAQRAGTAG